ncbi:MAG: virulence RhuM family protein [Desulforhopalus sp.]|nr:virulence RhuM family protein [Desulforhopalus sp.]
MGKNEEKCPQGELLVYQGKGLNTPIQVRLEGETVWLSQKRMADLFGVAVPTINEHISNIYDEEELLPEATIRKFRIVQTEGSRQVGRLIDHYNLEMIIAVGFRIRSRRGSQFRKWANDRISEYLVKGFTMDDERLKGKTGIVDYFDELLTRIREIRASEARVYLMIKNIFALASDYQEGEKETQFFFATMQNKMHYAATGLTAAEIVSKRAKAELPNMGLTNWKGSRVLKTDVGIAKNYLDHEEIDTLNRITVMFLDQAEFRAQRRQTILMPDWEVLLDKFLADVELPVLENIGSASINRRWTMPIHNTTNLLKNAVSKPNRRPIRTISTT